jgi:nitric oxide reductase NorD protein
VTDGEPAEIDVRDLQYLRHDTKKPIDDILTKGVFTYCLTLDPYADRYEQRIYGRNNYVIVDNLTRLLALFTILTAGFDWRVYANTKNSQPGFDW